MKKSMISRKVLFSLIAFALAFTGAQAQVHVASDGDVGIGNTSPSAKLHVSKVNTNSLYTAYFSDTDASASTKNGLYNYVNSGGTGSRYGMRNYVYNSVANTSSTYGAYNYTRGSKGYTRGLYNYTYTPTGNTSTNYGTYNYLYSSTSGTGYSLYNYCYTPSGANGARYGIYNRAYNNGNGTSYALYSSMEGSGSGTRYAGYFNGNVHIVGSLTQTSDARTKENIVAVEGALGLISQLQPKAYTFKADKDLAVAEGQQYGFLAQELEEILPGLVKTVEQPVAPGSNVIEPMSEEDIANGVEPAAQEEESNTKTLKSVNYIALIPILVQAVKEQQKEIEALRLELQNK